MVAIVGFQLVDIVSYSVDGYCWLFCWWLLLVILLVVILLVAISGY